MKRLIAISALFAIGPALAESLVPMRDVGNPIITKASMNEAQACGTRDIAHNGKPVVVPIDNGVEIDQLAETLLTKPVDPRFRLRITDQGDTRKIEAFYRHPVTMKVAAARLTKIQRECGL